MKPEAVLPLFVAIPLGGAFLISLFGRKIKTLANILNVTTSFAVFCLSALAVYLYNLYGVITYSVGGWRVPVGIGMVLDGLALFLLVIVNSIAFLVSIYSISYMERFTSKWKFYTLFFLMLAGMNGVIATGDIFNMFVFLEVASVASYALVAFGTERHELEASFKYAIMGTVGSLFILLSIAILYGYTSTLNLADMGSILANKTGDSIVHMVTVLLIMGFGLKAALIPFHAWLPDAHPSAPAPISAMLSGVLIKSLGIYTLCRIFYNVIGVSSNISEIFMFLGVLSMVVGGLLALGQWDFKRLLAYSSISQIGYIILGISLGNPLGILGGLFHLFNHSVFKSLLFLNSGAVEYVIETRDLKKMGGLIQKMPVTGTTAFFGAMSISGIPPFGGFWSKLLIIIACVQAERYGYAFWAALIGVLTIAMYMKVLKYAFFGRLNETWKYIKEVPLFMKIPMIALAILCSGSGVLLLPGVNEVFLYKAQQIISEGTKYAAVILDKL